MLTLDDIKAIVRHEADERVVAAQTYAEFGRETEAQRLPDEAAVLAGYLA